MAILQPLGTDYLDNSSHSKMHRVFAIDSASSDESVVVDSAGNVIIAENASAKMMKQANTWHAFGGFQDQAVTIALSQNVWAWITNATNNLWQMPEGKEITISGDIITVVNSGDYFGSLSLTMSGASTDDYFIRIYNITQGTIMGYKTGGSATGNSNYLTASLPFYLEDVVAGDTLRFEIQNISHSANAIIRDAIFYLSYLHN